jgi:manganese oxidase
MRPTSRASSLWVVVCLLAAAVAQAAASDEILANPNRTPAGKLANRVLTVQLELREGTWRPEAEDGPQVFVPAFAEVGKPAQIPGPLLRMPVGTTVDIKVTNKLKDKATLFGLNTRPGDAKAGIELAAGESRELSFAAGAAGTYFYWAKTTTSPKAVMPLRADAFLTGAFVVDSAGQVLADRIFVMNLMLVPPDVLHGGEEIVSINGKSYPYTEPLEYTQGETIRWRVINASFFEHPMHLHGAFYKLLTLGDAETETAYAEADQQSVVTENLGAAHTMMMEWKPQHPGRWLFHCHFQEHVSADERVPVVTEMESPHYAAAAMVSQDHHDSMSGMNDMAGLVLVTNVKAASGAAPNPSATPPHKVDLVIEPTVASGKSPTFSCSVREGKKLVASLEKSMGPPIILMRGEPVEITITNHLAEPTTIHWHGLELDAYYDGVVGGGTADHVTPAVPPGGTFVARFTPNRAGTFIYHTHAADPDQLTGGIYGALIVLEPGEAFDPEHDRVIMLGTREASFFAKRITINGEEAPDPMVFQRGVRYRLRLINMAPNLAADFQLGSKEHPVIWDALAKDGAKLPARLAKPSDATLHIASGETYDFEFQPKTAGEIPLQVENIVNDAKLETKIVVQ